MHLARIAALHRQSHLGALPGANEVVTRPRTGSAAEGTLEEYGAI